jgi:PleD family two-component response regulator
VDLDDLIGPLPAPLGRWMLRRMVAAGVRYGHDFVVLILRGADPDAVAGLLRGADVIAHWDEDLLVLLPDTDRAGGARVAERVREATGAAVGVAHWGGDLADELVERAERSLAAQV